MVAGYPHFRKPPYIYTKEVQRCYLFLPGWWNMTGLGWRGFIHPKLLEKSWPGKTNTWSKYCLNMFKSYHSNPEWTNHEMYRNVQKCEIFGGFPFYGGIPPVFPPSCHPFLDGFPPGRKDSRPANLWFSPCSWVHRRPHGGWRKRPWVPQICVNQIESTDY